MKLYHELSPPQLKARRTRWKNLSPEQQLAKWAKALCSGRYKQIRGNLEYRGTNCRCALGVLADISGSSLFGLLLCSRTPLSFLDPGEVAEWNDCDLLTFDEIADLLESA